MTKLTSIYCLLGKSTSYLFVGFHTQPGLQIFAGLQETQDIMVHKEFMKDVIILNLPWTTPDIHTILVYTSMRSFIIVSVIWVRATDRNISVLLVSLCQFREWGSPSWLGCRQSWWIALVIIKVNLSPLSILTLHQLHFNVDDHSSIKAIVVTWSASHPCEHRSHLGCPPWSCYHDIMSSLLTHIISLISNKHWPWYWWRKLLLFLGITALLKFVTIVCDGMIFHEDDGNSEKEEHLHTLTMECE